MTTQVAIEKVREILLKRYPDYWTKPGGLRMLLAASVLALDIKVREGRVNNSGEWVEAILGSSNAGAKSRAPWCAAAQEFERLVAKVPHENTVNDASVLGWRTWASKAGRLTKTPARGHLCTRLNADGVTGHMGIVAEVLPNGSLRTYEGNTSSDAKGDQRDGDVFTPKTRPPGYFDRFIDMN